MLELKSIILPVYVIWCFLLLFFLFRRGPGALWKACGVLIFVFYGIYHYREIMDSYTAFEQSFNVTLVSMGISLFKSFGSVLFLLWPVMLWVSYYASSDELSKTVIRWMVLLTLFFWVFYFLFEFYPPVDRSTVEGWLPGKFSVPDIPSPPTR